MRTGAIQYLGVGGSSMRSVVRVVLGLTYTRHGHSRVSCPAAEEGLECRRCYLIFALMTLLLVFSVQKISCLITIPILCSIICTTDALRMKSINTLMAKTLQT